MLLEDLKYEYDKLQLKYGDSSLDSIYNGGCEIQPDIMFVFMNPTKRIIASSKDWNGPKSPWIGIKNIWSLFFEVGLLDSLIYNEIQEKNAKEWTIEFAKRVYTEVEEKKYFITNLGKCTQLDARALPDSVYLEYLDLLFKEIEIVRPKVIILFGNQVSSIVLAQKISVSNVRRTAFIKKINDVDYKFYSVFYPIGNGRHNIGKSIEDIRWIISKELGREVGNTKKNKTLV